MTITHIPFVYEKISFDPKEATTEIIFHGKFADGSGTPRLSAGGSVRYGERNGDQFVAITAYSMLARTVSMFVKQFPDEKIECTVIKGSIKFKGVVYAVERPDELSICPLGLVIIQIFPMNES